MRRLRIIWLIVGVLLLSDALAQSDSLETEQIVLTPSDTFSSPIEPIVWDEARMADSLMVEVAQADSLLKDTAIAVWKPDPIKAVWLGAIVPGLGQIYNRKYWKLPIVYGALVGCGFAIGLNSKSYNDYKIAYRDILTGQGTSYLDMLPEGYTIATMGGMSNYKSYLNNMQTSYRRYRDISIVVTAVVYALSLIDAYVDAQLYDFDISPNLSMNVRPQIYQDVLNNNAQSAEMLMAITLK